jgi:hypothetical protein
MWARTIGGWIAAVLLVLLLAWGIAGGSWDLVAVLGLVTVLGSRRLRRRLTRLARRLAGRPRGGGPGRVDRSGIGRALWAFASLDSPRRPGARFPGRRARPTQREQGSRRYGGPRESYYVGPDGTFWTSDGRYDQDRDEQRRRWQNEDDYWARRRDEDRWEW